MPVVNSSCPLLIKMLLCATYQSVKWKFTAGIGINWDAAFGRGNGYGILRKLWVKSANGDQESEKVKNTTAVKIINHDWQKISWKRHKLEFTSHGWYRGWTICKNVYLHTHAQSHTPINARQIGNQDLLQKKVQNKGSANKRIEKAKK